jgi:hypothetical protein
MSECSSPLSQTCRDVRRITITLEHNAAMHDWSIDINGQQYEHITSEIAEAFVEHQMIVAETILTHEQGPNSGTSVAQPGHKLAIER